MTSDDQLWLIEIAIEPKDAANNQKLAAALAKLVTHDPAFGFSIDPRSGQTILKGTSERDLGVKIDTLVRTYAIDANIGGPQVAYLERISRPVTVAYAHKQQTGGSGRFASVKIVAEPLPSGLGYIFENKIPPESMPQDYVSGVEAGLKSVLGSGIRAGFPVVDLKVTLIDGACHNVDSSALAFEIAARMALREALLKGDAVLLEPIMKVEVATPELYAKTIVADLNARRARIDGQNARGNAKAVSALVPLANMFGYADVLTSLSQGSATFVMAFDHYPPLPDDDPPFRPAIGMRV